MKQIIERLHKREDFERLVLELLNPLKPHYSHGSGLRSGRGLGGRIFKAVMGACSIVGRRKRRVRV